MSFILDAIAKSEQERQQQLAPDASRLAIPVSATANRSRKGIYLVVGALLLNAALLVLWIQWRDPVVGPVVESSGAGAESMPEIVKLEQPPARTQPAPTVPVETPKPETETLVVETAPVAAESPVIQPVEQDTRAQVPAAEEVAVVTVVTETPALPVRTEITTQQDASTSSNQVAPATEPDSTATVTQPLIEEALLQPESPPRKISRLSDLPADVRRALPSMKFTGHLYSSNPRARYVFIGDRQIVAGQRISDDLFLDSITPTGVVVEFQEYLIEVGVLQNWSLN